MWVIIVSRNWPHAIPFWRIKVKYWFVFWLVSLFIAFERLLCSTTETICLFSQIRCTLLVTNAANYQIIARGKRSAWRARLSVKRPDDNQSQSTVTIRCSFKHHHRYAPRSHRSPVHDWTKQTSGPTHSLINFGHNYRNEYWCPARLAGAATAVYFMFPT